MTENGANQGKQNKTRDLLYSVNSLKKISFIEKGVKQNKHKKSTHLLYSVDSFNTTKINYIENYIVLFCYIVCHAIHPHTRLTKNAPLCTRVTSLPYIDKHDLTEKRKLSLMMCTAKARVSASLDTVCRPEDATNCPFNLYFIVLLWNIVKLFGFPLG